MGVGYDSLSVGVAKAEILSLEKSTINEAVENKCK